MRAIFHDTTGDSDVVVGSIELLDDGTLVAEGIASVHRQAREPAGMRARGPLVEPTEGEAFLQALADQYSGTYLRVQLEGLEPRP